MNAMATSNSRHQPAGKERIYPLANKSYFLHFYGNAEFSLIVTLVRGASVNWKVSGVSNRDFAAGHFTSGDLSNEKGWG
jgi:hypothetical protein